MNVTFWDNMAEDFQNEIDTFKFEYPLIIIVASGRVSKWKSKCRNITFILLLHVS